METISLPAFVKERTGIYADLNANGRVIMQCASADATVSANRVLLESLLDNLVVNAMRHKPADTDIIIAVSGNSLSVTNDDDADTPLDKNLLFRRFSNRGQQKRGNGLGLSIVKAICDYHHWTISYIHTDNRHIFVVDF
jgi:signal transduction histidine kinase